MESKKLKNKLHTWEKVLIITSALFIITCLIFYGSRLIRYYKIYNPKIDGEAVELIMNSVVKNTEIVYEKDGLYRVSGTYIYKGSTVNNYIRYSNMLWRIVKFNSDGSLDIILDGNINMLKWNNEVTDYMNSDINSYLNNYFYPLINDEYLTKTTICTDEIDDLNSITCNNKNADNYVRLLSVSEYLNSKITESYINDGNIWLSNYNNDSVWNITDNSLSESSPDNMYYIKPVITLKNSTTLISGSGTKDDPYIVDENHLGVGSFVKIDNDIWSIYDVSNNIYRLNSTTSIGSMSYGSNTYDLTNADSIAYYLNNTFLSSLSYQDILIETDWFNGEYDDYKSISNNSVKAKVGMLNIADLKITDLENYYLINSSDEDKIYLYSSLVKDCNYNIEKDIVPTIALSNINVLSGSGTLEDPYILEV
ncbi:MAG: hypothetical protein PHD02_02690 [Bacilli bacterium]|nr:hypothetical protein [Bacilli bacterium]